MGSFVSKTKIIHSETEIKFKLRIILIKLELYSELYKYLNNILEELQTYKTVTYDVDVYSSLCYDYSIEHKINQYLIYDLVEIKEYLNGY